METNTGKESIVSRLFGFGKKRKQEAAGQETRRQQPAEEGFARIDSDEPSITVPEQVIRVRTNSRRDDAVHVIGESFRELSTMLSSVNDRLDRQDDRAGVLTENLSELPEYLRTLPRLQEEQNSALQAVAQAQENQVHAVEGMAAALNRIPDALRDSTAAQEQAIRKVAAAQHQTAKVMHHGHQKSLQAFEQATRKSLQQQQRQVDTVLAASQRMFFATVVFMAITIVTVVAVLLLR